MSKLRSRAFSSFLGLGLLTFALWALYRELEGHRYADVLENFRGLPNRAILIAVLLTILSYVVQTGYDWLAFRSIRNPAPYRTVAPVSFIAYALSNTMGYAVFTAGSVRYRFYTALGISATQVAQIVLFCSLTFWLGLATVLGVVFLFEPIDVPDLAPGHGLALRALGILLLAAVAGYLALLKRAKGKPVRFRSLELTPPPPRLGPAQILISSLDWLLAATVVYVLLDADGVSLPHFLAVYFVAQAVALMSGVPGGLGVFEGLVVLALSPTIPADEALASLLAYRTVYYLVPFCLALLLLLVHELRQRLGSKPRIEARVAFLRQSAPHLFALTTFLTGAILLFSGALPALPGRIRQLESLLPLPVIEFSHFLGSLSGAALIILARGIQLRLRAAHAAAVVLLAAGAVFSLFKGLDFEEATVLTVMLCLLVMARQSFYRNSSLLSQPFTFGWVIAICLVLVCTAWLGLFAYKHVDYSSQIWWQFSLAGDAPRYLRAMVGASALTLLFALAKLLRPEPARPTLPSDQELQTVGAIVSQSPHTLSQLALLGDKHFLFSEDREAFIMYRVWGDSWIALGDPVGPEAEWPDLLWEFRRRCSRSGDRPVFYQVGANHLPLYLDLGLTLLKLGEEARVRLELFSLDGAGRKGLRHNRNRLEKDRCRFEVVPSPPTSSLLDEMEAVSKAWLESKSTREKGFSLGHFDRDYLSRFPTALVRRQDGLLAFANVWEGADREEVSVDLMRHLPDAADGLMDYLFVSLMLWGKDAGYRYFNLGMAPLSGFPERDPAPVWNRIARLVYRHGERFYNFQGLRRYKEKFDPEWRPRYLASPGGLSMVRALTDLASLISGGVKGVFSK